MGIESWTSSCAWNPSQCLPVSYRKTLARFVIRAVQRKGVLFVLSDVVRLWNFVHVKEQGSRSIHAFLDKFEYVCLLLNLTDHSARGGQDFTAGDVRNGCGDRTRSRCNEGCARRRWHHVVGYDVWLVEISPVLVPGGYFLSFTALRGMGLRYHECEEALMKKLFVCESHRKVLLSYEEVSADAEDGDGILCDAYLLAVD